MQGRSENRNVPNGSKQELNLCEISNDPILCLPSVGVNFSTGKKRQGKIKLISNKPTESVTNE